MSFEGIVVGLVAIVVGGAWAFYGLSLFTILLPLWAFVFGFLVGMQWSHDVFGQGFFTTVLGWAIGIGFGFFLAAISYFWYYAAVTIAAGALGYAFGVGILDALNIDAAILGIVVGLIVGGALAIATFVAGVPAFLIIYFSAISGAAGVVNGVLILLGRIKVENLESNLLGGLLTDGIIAVVAWIVLSAIAIFWQLQRVTETAVAIRRESYRF
jgi:hypothetical protein